MVQRLISALLKNLTNGVVTVYIQAFAGTAITGSGYNVWFNGNYVTGTVVNSPNQNGSTVYQLVFYDPGEEIGVTFAYDDRVFNPPICGNLTEYGIIKVYADPKLQDLEAVGYANNTFQFTSVPVVANIYVQPSTLTFKYVGQTQYATLYIEIVGGCAGTWLHYWGVSWNSSVIPVSINGPSFNNTFTTTAPGQTVTITFPFSVTLNSNYVNGVQSIEFWGVVNGTVYYQQQGASFYMPWPISLNIHYCPNC